MNRDNWHFPYSADKIHAAALKKLHLHEGRLRWWTDQRAATLQKLKDEGITITESLAAETKYTSNNYRSPGVNLDNELVAQLNECNYKVAEHREKVKDYSGWVQVLASQGASVFPLHQEDWLFFFGEAPPATDGSDA